MLIYHPAQDAYHCVFRMLAILDKVRELEVDKARILDFYLAFPSALASIRWPTHLRHAKKLAKTEDNPYRDPISPATTFRGMHLLQSAALRCIAASNLIDAPAFELNSIQRTDTPLTEAVQSGINYFFQRNEAVADLVLEHLSAIPLSGRDGLKARTSLMEYRYDSA